MRADLHSVPLLARATLTMCATAIAIRLLPPSLWRRFMRATRAGAAATHRAPSISDILRAVNRASRIIPGGQNCLVRAFTARVLMARAGLDAQLTLGVSKTEGGDFEAHAWLQHQGRVLIGEGTVERYAPLPDLKNRW